jgi:hypothetical protein
MSHGLSLIDLITISHCYFRLAIKASHVDSPSDAGN